MFFLHVYVDVIMKVSARLHWFSSFLDETSTYIYRVEVKTQKRDTAVNIVILGTATMQIITLIYLS
jgi:hypothetical protein